MKIKEAYDVLWKNIEQWSNPEYYTDEQMQTAKNLLAIQDSYGKESTSNFIHLVTYWWASASIEYYTNYVENLQKVTKQDFANYVSKYIKDKPHVVGLMIPASMKEMIDVTSMGFQKPE
jgi:zinc protease